MLYCTKYKNKPRDVLAVDFVILNFLFCCSPNLALLFSSISEGKGVHKRIENRTSAVVFFFSIIH
jgi:hypothetical protein